jgi:hypothetical protein
MPFYKIEDNNKISEIKPRSFIELGMGERTFLQPIIRDNFSDLFPDLFVISEEFSNWQESLRRVDLLAIDKEANLVVVELKRIEDGGHMELQAIRYAAMLSMMTFADVVAAYEKMLEKQHLAESKECDPTEARLKICGFLGISIDEEKQISDVPKILLISPGYSREITTTVLWLNKIGISVTCFEVKPYLIDNKQYLDIEQVIPLPSAEEYMVKMREKTAKADEIEIAVKRRSRTIAILRERGILTEGMGLVLIKPPRPKMNIPEEAKYAVFVGGQNAQWGMDNQVYSLSGLCLEICKQYGGSVGSGAFAGPEYWGVEGGDGSTSLADLAKQLELV